jgi:hypothetical protein
MGMQVLVFPGDISPGRAAQGILRLLVDQVGPRRASIAASSMASPL